VLVREGEMRLHRTTGELLPRSLRVRDVMTADPVTVKADDRVREVFSLLVRSEFDAVPVTDTQGRLLGMVGPEDLVEKTGLHATAGVLAALWQAPATEVPEAELVPVEVAAITARQMMTSRVQTVAADSLLVDAVRTMVKENLKRLPVLDAEKRLVGMLSRIDVLRVAHAGTSRLRVCEQHGASVPGTMLVGEADLLVVPTVPPETPIRDVLEDFDREARRVVVLDEQGAPLGVLSDRDLLPLLDPKNKKKLDGLTARSLMRTVPTIRRGAGIDEALVWMVEHRRQRLPVVDADGKYVGMLSREELLRIVTPRPATPGQR
jgi:CBS domain-containing protein